MAKAGSSKPTGTQEVLRFLHNSQHPLKTVMTLLRDLILSSQKGITEHIKWNGPSFCYAGDDRITFNLHREDHILVVFHCGSKAKGKETRGAPPLFEDSTGLLEWLSDQRAVSRFCREEEVTTNKNKIKKLVKDWLKATAVHD